MGLPAVNVILNYLWRVILWFQTITFFIYIMGGIYMLNTLDTLFLLAYKLFWFPDEGLLLAYLLL